MKTMEAVMEELTRLLREELKAQGHVNTGKLSNSIEYSIREVTLIVTGTMYAEDYGIKLDTGLKPDEIPRSGTASQKYVAGLVDYFRSKGFSTKASQVVAIRTFFAHQREGMPTRASFKFSSNGYRTGWISRTLENSEQRIEEIIAQNQYDEFQLALNNIITRIAA